MAVTATNTRQIQARRRRAILPRLFWRGASASRANPVPPPPPPKTGCGAEPVNALRRAGHGLKAAFTAGLLLALAAVLAPQDAGAQDFTITVGPGSKQVTLNYRTSRPPSSIREWGYQVGTSSRNYQSNVAIPDSGGKSSGSHVVSGLTSGETYYFRIRTTSTDGANTFGNEVSVTLPTVTLTVNGNDGWFGFEWVYDGPTDGAVSWQLEWIRLSDRNGEGRWLDLPGGVALRAYSYSATNGETGIFRVRLVGPGGRTTIASSTVNNQGWVEATPRAATPTLVSTASRTLAVTPGGTVNACFNLLSVTAGDTTYLEARPGQTAVAQHAALSHGTHGVRISSNVDGVRTEVGQNLYPCAALGVGVHTVRWHWKGHDGTAATEASTSTTFTVVQVPDRTKDLSANPVSGKPGEIFLRWRDPIESGITWEYQYKEGAGSYGAWTAASLQSTGIPDTLGTTVTGLKPGTTYTFQVRARNDGGAGAASAEESATTVAPLVPAAPTGFAASPGSTKVWLTWTDPEDASITGWEYQQKAGGGSYGSWTAVTGSTATTTHVEVTGLTNDTAYAFKLRAVSDAGNGTASAEQTATPGAQVAAVLTGTAGADGAHDLTWTTTSGGPHRIVNNANHIGLWYAYYRARGRTTWGGPSYTGGAGTRKWSTSGSPHGAVFEYLVQPAGSRIIAGLGSFNWKGPESNVIELTVNKPDSPALTFADAPVTVSPGQTATYTVKLNQAFAGTLALSSSAAGKARVSPSSLTFTTSNYNVARAVTVTGVAAGTATLNHAFTLTGASKTFIPDAGTVSVTVGSGGGQVPAKPTVFAAAAGNGQAVLTWANPNNASITGYKLRYAKTGDRSSATWTAIPGSGATTATHTVMGLDNDAEYSFRLRAVNGAGDGAATDWVTATPSSAPAALAKPVKPVLTAAAGDGSVTLSWSAQTDIASWVYQYKSGAGSWSATRTVSDGSATSTEVTGLTNGTAYTFRLFARRGSGASAVQSVWSDEVTATPVGVVVSKSALTVAEGASGAYTVKLSTAPSSDVTVTVGGASGDVTVSPPSLTFTSTSYNTAQTVTVSAAQDPDGDTDPAVTLSHSASGGGYGSVAVDNVVVTVTEDDTKGVTVSSGALTVVEGGTGSYTVKLDTQPSGEVVVTVEGASGDVTVPDSQLRFAVNNWSEAQTVTVNAALDTDADTDPDVTLTHGVSGGGYGSVSIADVVVSVTEAVSLPAAPTGLTATGGNGQVVLTWSNPSDASITGYELSHGKTGVRGSAAWTAISSAGATTTTHTVTGLDNDSEYSFRLRAVNPAGNGAETGWVTATPQTPTVPGVTVSTAALRVAEGGSGTYTVRLDTAPSSDVTVTVDGASGDVTVTGTPLTFTPSDWTVPQTVTVNAGTDTDTDTDPDVTLTHGASGGGYGSVSIASVVVSVVESGVAPAKPTGLAAAAGDGSVTLSWADLTNPTVTKWQYRQKAVGGAWGKWTDMDGSDAGTTRHEVRGLTNGTAYQFEVRAVNAAGPGAGPDAPASATPVAASGGGGGPTAPPPPTPAAVGVTVTPTALTVEEGSSATYTVKLDTEPSADVTVRVSGASGEVTVTGSPLTFTPGDYSTAQTITVNAGADDDTTDDRATLTHAASSSDPDYGASLEIDDVEVTVTDTTPLPVLTLAQDPAAVAEGEDIRLVVTADRALTGSLRVSLTLAARGAGGFDAGDVPGGLGPRLFDALFGAAGSRTGVVTIPTAADTDVEGAEGYRVTLNDAADYTVGSDATAAGVLRDRAPESAARANRVNAAVLPQVAAAAMSQTLGAVTGRIEAAASGKSGGSMQFGALPSPVEDDRAVLPRWDRSGPTLREMLDGASFTLAPGSAAGEAFPAPLAVWGRGEWVSVSGSEKDVSWDGGLWSAQLGADLRVRPDLLAGAALSHAWGELDTETSGGGGRVKGVHETVVTSFNPYAAWLAPDGSTLWASLGYGRGEVRVREKGAPVRSAGLTQWSASAGGRGVLAEDAALIGGGVTRLALKGEGSAARLRTGADDGLTALTVKTTRLRLLLEGSYEHALEGGATLTPVLEAGVRHDGGDAAEGAGLEAGASVTWRDPAAGLTAALRARLLAVHEADRDEWGVSALVRLDPGADGRGTFLSFGPAHGRTESGLGQWFDHSLPAAASGAAPEEARSRLEAEVGHGFGLTGPGPLAVLTPWAGLSLAETGGRTLRLGVRYRLGTRLSLGLEGAHRPGPAPEDSLLLRGALRW